MEVSSLLIRLVFLVFPGIVGSKVYRKLRGRADRPAWEDSVEIVMFAVAAYVVHGMAAWILSGAGLDVHFTIFRAFLDEKTPIEWSTVAVASCIAVALAMIGSLFHYKQWLMRVGRWMRVSNRSGDGDLWEYFHELPDTVWVFVRDHKVDLVYFGWIAAYSDSGKERELILRDVQVFENTRPADVIYATPVMYLARNRDDLTLEIPSPMADNIVQPTDEAPIHGTETNHDSNHSGQIH